MRGDERGDERQQEQRDERARGDAGEDDPVGALAAAVFVAWMLAPLVGDQLLRAELGYAGAAALLCGLLAGLYARA